MANINEVVHKPWGINKNIFISHNFIVKILTINPKCKISLQYHSQRPEHLEVTEGIAFVTNGESEFILKKNESTYIEIEEIHRIENKVDEKLIIVEVQIGSEINEDDIVRLDDIYGRMSTKKF